MSLDLFLAPGLTGLCLAILLPLVGVYLRLRREWLVALAVAQVAAAGALAFSLLAGPPMLGGLLAALGVGLAKPTLLRRIPGGAAYPLLFLLGWAASILLAANHPLAERLGHALFDGQLYFATWAQCASVAAFAGPAVLALQRLSADLLRARLYPDHHRLQKTAPWRTGLAFDLLAALTVAQATMSLGVMGAVALIFVPPWVAFQRAAHWRAALRWALGLGVVAYGLAFAIALGFDQPFGPVLAVCAVGLGLLLAR